MWNEFLVGMQIFVINTFDLAIWIECEEGLDLFIQ